MNDDRNTSWITNRSGIAKKLVFVAVASLILPLAFFAFVYTPKISEGFPVRFVQDLASNGTADPTDYAPDAAYVCVVGGYTGLSDFAASKGIDTQIALSTGESDFAILIENEDGKVEHYLNRYRSGYPIISKIGGCFQADGYIFSLQPIPDARDPAAKFLNVSLREEI